VFVGSFDKVAGLKQNTGSDECDQMWRVDHASAVLRGLDELQLQRHHQTGRW
jgi:hypothetical protein